MSKFQSQLKSHYAKAFGNPQSSYFDFARKNNLNPVVYSYRNTNKIIGRALGISFAAIGAFMILVPVAGFVATGIREETSFKANRVFNAKTIAEAKARHDERVRSLNSIVYPKTQQKLNISSDFVADMNHFSESLLLQMKDKGTFVASSLGLYGNLHLSSLAISDASLSEQMNQLLGHDANYRSDYVRHAFMNNFFSEEKVDIYASQAAFIDSDFGANSNFVDGLTASGAEAYEGQLEDVSVQNAILDWVDRSVGAKNYVQRDEMFIGNPSEFGMMLLSAIKMDIGWNSSFSESNNRVLPFYMDNGTTDDRTFMSHTYLGYLEDRGNYISFVDYYRSGYTVQYLVPKEHSDSIFDLLPNEGFLSFAETNINLARNSKYIELKVPKFETNSKIDFTDTLSSMGLTRLYDSNSNVMLNAYTNPDIVSSYLAYTKQFNGIEFKEDGTTAKSITFALAMGATSAAPMDDGYSISLDQKFIYCIRDPYQIPLFIGVYGG